MILFQLGQTIKDENGSGSVVVITSGQESQMSYQEKVAFEAFLPLNQKQVQFNISSVVEFLRWWVLKCKIFGQESTFSKDFF